MDYRQAVLKAQEVIVNVDFVVSDVADALIAAYEAGKSADDSQPVQNWRVGEQSAEVLRQDVDTYCEAHGLKVVPSECGMCVTAEVWNSLRADERRMDFIRVAYTPQVDGFVVDRLGPKGAGVSIDEWLDAAIKKDADK